jgi:PHD/YefM family antitoxin component YafN of YafNO toxin-antitoxin module
MYSINFDSAFANFPKLVADTIQSSEEVVIVTDEGSVVMLKESDWESVKEMLKLLKDKKSLAALLDSHKARDKGQSILFKSSEQVFDDL